jgi:hypothetical protein
VGNIHRWLEDVQVPNERQQIGFGRAGPTMPPTAVVRVAALRFQGLIGVQVPRIKRFLKVRAVQEERERHRRRMAI